MLELSKFILGARYHFIVTKGTSAYPGLCPVASWHVGIFSLSSFQKDIL